MYKLEKYKQNLSIQGNKVWSYTTNVATIDGNKLIQHGWWSVTTQKHINYVAKELDLDLGLLGEKLTIDILTNKKIEVKTDYKALQTKNVFVEYFSRGKESGISVSQSDWYCFIISNDNIIFIKTKKLKILCRKYLNTTKDVLGGDNNTSAGILLPLKELIQ